MRHAAQMAHGSDEQNMPGRHCKRTVLALAGVGSWVEAIAIRNKDERKGRKVLCSTNIQVGGHCYWVWGVQVCGSRPFLRRQRWAGHGCAHRLGVSQHSKISRKKSCNDGLQPSNGLQPAMDCRRIQKANVTSERHGSATCPMEVK